MYQVGRHGVIKAAQWYLVAHVLFCLEHQTCDVSFLLGLKTCQFASPRLHLRLFVVVDAVVVVVAAAVVVVVIGLPL